MENSENVKVQVFVPEEYADKLRLAIGDAGGGQMGNYSHCSFVSKGEGNFLPLEGAKPAIGKIGKPEKVSEAKIEFFCHKDKLKKVLETIKEVHPYEEPATEIFPLLEQD